MTPQDIMDSMKRADVYRYHDWKTNIMHLVSRNFEEPLTDKEKDRIIFHLGLTGFPLEVQFDN